MALNHLVSRKYLEGFETERGSGVVWQFDKSARTWSRKPLPTATVGARNAYYTDDDESALAEIIEGPAHPHIARIRMGGDITPEAQRRMAAYMACQMSRVENWRAKARSVYPGEWRKVVEKWRTILTISGRADQLPELEEIAEKWRAKMPPEIEAIVFNPGYMLRHVKVLLDMRTRWRVVENRRADFITSDNPVVFDEALGIGRPESEIAWTLSPRIALYLSRADNVFNNSRNKIRPHLATTLNHWVARTADRFIFAHRPAEWIHGKHGSASRPRHPAAM